MANYVASARSNYFAVRDQAAFKLFCRDWNVELTTDESRRDGGTGQPLVGFLVNDGGIPTCRRDRRTGETIESDDFIAELAKYLRPDFVAVVQEMGSEGMRYLIGYAVAVNSRGRTVTVDLDDIYKCAKPLGETITAATWPY